MKLLFIGEAWLGSCAKSLMESLDRIEEIEIIQLNEEQFFKKRHNIFNRIVNRLFYDRQIKVLNKEVLRNIESFKPNAVVVYKGSHINKELLDRIKEKGCLTVNIYPDLSPHGHSASHKIAVGVYDLVISTKVFHPEKWQNTYGYSNECLFVPQGYDPELHLSPFQPHRFGPDVALVATYRREYGDLMLELAEQIKDANLSVVIGGNGWDVIRGKFPTSWRVEGPVIGQAYIDLLKSSKICIAPLTTKIYIQGKSQPGDVDTTRSYELAAANCFFIHRRTEYMQKLYDEILEVPMFNDAKELAEHIMFYLENETLRNQMARAAHNRAVPAYSLDNRAKEIVEILGNKLNKNVKN